MPGSRPRLRVAALAGALIALLPIAAAAQAAPPAGFAERGLPDASFDVVFRKLLPPENAFSPYYSWDAQIAFRLTVLRRGSGAFDFSALFQTVGTENFGSRVGVGGTGYLLGLSYVHTRSPDLTISAGIVHLSAHLTRDLDEKTDEQRRRGAAIPDVADSDEYNVVFVKGRRRFSHWRFAPEIHLVVAPLDLRFSGAPRAHVRPIFVETRSTLWSAAQRAIVVETQHELGTRPFNQFLLALELDTTDGRGRRLRIFVSGSPGRGLHVSPHIGGLRDGLAAGAGMTFRD